MAGSQSTARVHWCCRCSHPQTQTQTHTYTHCFSQGWDSSFFSCTIAHCLVQQATLRSNRAVGFLWGPLEVWYPTRAPCTNPILLHAAAATLSWGNPVHPSCCPWFSGLSQTNGINLANHWVLFLGRCSVAFPQYHLNNETILSHSVTWYCQADCPSNSLRGDRMSPQWESNIWKE